MRTFFRQAAPALSGLLAFAAALIPCVAPAANAKTDLPMAVFGFGSGAKITGTNPRFNVFVPDYRSARRMDVRFALEFPAAADGRGIVTVRVDGEAIGSSTVAALRAGSTVGGVFDRFTGSGRMLDVSVESSLGTSGSVCHAYDPRGLWMRVLSTSHLVVEHSNAPPANVSEFFENYDGRYAVTVAPKSPDKVRLAAVALGYWLNQFQRWRHARLSFLSVPAQPVRKIVLENAKQDVVVRGGTLYVTPHGIELLVVSGTAVVVAADTNRVAEVKGRSIPSPASFDALGVGTRTQRGAGNLIFKTGFTLGAFGGLPQALHAHLELSHESYPEVDQAKVTILLNGGVVNGFSLSHKGGTEYYDVPIDERRLGPANELEVVVEYVPTGCSNAPMSVSLLGTSTLAWRGVANYPPAIGEFFNESAGSMGVAVSSANLDGYTFELLDRLGSIDPNLSRLNVHRYRGTPLAHVDEAIYVSAPEALKEVPLAWNPATGQLRMTKGRKGKVFEAKVGEAYGLLRAARTSMPVLVLTYTNSKVPGVLATLSAVSTADLSGARYDLMIFNDRGIAYNSPAKVITQNRSSPTPIRSSWPLIVLFVVIVAIALVLIARRARQVS